MRLGADPCSGPCALPALKPSCEAITRCGIDAGVARTAAWSRVVIGGFVLLSKRVAQPAVEVTDVQVPMIVVPAES